MRNVKAKPVTLTRTDLLIYCGCVSGACGSVFVARICARTWRDALVHRDVRMELVADEEKKKKSIISQTFNFVYTIPNYQLILSFAIPLSQTTIQEHRIYMKLCWPSRTWNQSNVSSVITSFRSATLLCNGFFFVLDFFFSVIRNWNSLETTHVSCTRTHLLEFGLCSVTHTNVTREHWTSAKYLCISIHMNIWIHHHQLSMPNQNPKA